MWESTNVNGFYLVWPHDNTSCRVPRIFAYAVCRPQLHTAHLALCFRQHTWWQKLDKRWEMPSQCKVLIGMESTAYVRTRSQRDMTESKDLSVHCCCCFVTSKIAKSFERLAGSRLSLNCVITRRRQDDVGKTCRKIKTCYKRSLRTEEYLSRFSHRTAKPSLRSYRWYVAVPPYALMRLLHAVRPGSLARFGTSPLFISFHLFHSRSFPFPTPRAHRLALAPTTQILPPTNGCQRARPPLSCRYRLLRIHLVPSQPGENMGASVSQQLNESITPSALWRSSTPWCVLVDCPPLNRSYAYYFN